MTRRPRPYRWIAQLAMLATLLMVLAPLVSRALQPTPVEHAAHAQTPANHAAPASVHAHHHGTHHPLPAPQATSASVPADPHALHGEACEYCVLAGRLLPWLAACLLLWPPLRWRSPPHREPVLPTPTVLHWPAHAVRGPPSLL